MNFSTTPPSASTADADGREVAAHDLLQVLGVQPLRQRGGVDQVGEEDGDELELLADRRGQQPVALLDQRRQRGLDDGVPEDRALALQRGDRLLQGGQLAGRGGGLAHRRRPEVRSTIGRPLSRRDTRTLPPSPAEEDPFPEDHGNANEGGGPKASPLVQGGARGAERLAAQPTEVSAAAAGHPARPGWPARASRCRPGTGSGSG